MFKRNRTSPTRILFATDLHGSEMVFRKFLNAVSVYEAQIAILGGDLTGKRLVPIVEAGDRWTTTIGGEEVIARDQDDLDALTDRIRNLGQYPIVIDRDEYQRLQDDPEAVDARFRAECDRQVTDWMRRAAERLAPSAIPIYVTGGNDDFMSIEEIIDTAEYVTNAEGRVVEVLPEVKMMSSGYSNQTPWHCPRDIPEEELETRLEAMAVELGDCSRAIFNLHVPPMGSGLDQCPRLDTTMSPPRPMVGEEIAAGSTAVRAAIERHQPILSLHGHIHESRGIQRIGHTTCVNPGSEYGEGVLRSAVADLVPGDDHVHVQLLAA
jgi:Icc-related predicted phosphoesterase